MNTFRPWKRAHKTCFQGIVTPYTSRCSFTICLLHLYYNFILFNGKWARRSTQAPHWLPHCATIRKHFEWRSHHWTRNLQSNGKPNPFQATPCHHSKPHTTTRVETRPPLGEKHDHPKNTTRMFPSSTPEHSSWKQNRNTCSTTPKLLHTKMTNFIPVTKHEKHV